MEAEEAVPESPPHAQQRFELLQEKLVPLWQSIQAMNQDEQTIVVVDFDVAESFGQVTGSDAWVMRPVLRADYVEFTSTIEVTVEKPGGGPAEVDATLRDRDGDSAGTIRLADADGDGKLEGSFRYVIPSEGPYTLELHTVGGVLLLSEPPTPLQIEIESGTVTEVAVTLLPAG